MRKRNKIFKTVAETVRQDGPKFPGIEVGISEFRYLWELSHGKMERIPLKAETLKSLLEWMVRQMNGKLLKKLGLTPIAEATGLVEKVEQDQRRRTVVRKQKQLARATKKKAKKKT